MTSGQHIDYDALALEALRGVVRACLAQVSRTGLVGDHHFYIAFNTQAAGVGMSKRLKEKYPVEMTIVLQHRFWDLAVDDERFEVKLTFDGIPERLVIPFAAVKVFYDPSVPYVLQFEEVGIGAQGDGRRRPPRRSPPGRQPGAAPAASAAAAAAADAASDNSAPKTGAEADAQSDRSDRRRPVRRNRPEREGGEAADGERTGADAVAPAERTPHQPIAPPPAAEKPVTAPPAAAPGAKPAIVAVGKAGDDAAKPDDEKPSPDEGGAKIFDLSKFRGKK
jgi:hypothetical protein